MNEDQIEEKVRQRLKNSSLPNRLPVAKPGQRPEFVAVCANKELPCAACDGPNPNVKIPFNQGDLWFHARCSEIWEEERPKP
jgi:hypothetical protein